MARGGKDTRRVIYFFMADCSAWRLQSFCVQNQGKVQQKPFAGRDIERGKVNGFGKLPTRENPRPAHSVKTGILRKGYPFPMLAAQVASGKWVLICCACSLLKTRKGRERNGEETKNGTQ